MTSSGAPAQMQAFFLALESGQRFCLFHPARGKARGRVLYIHPFAEEMNKSRRMVALQARQLAGAGFSVLQIDLQGCGDSSGDTGDARWSGWVEDALQAHRWLRDRADGPLWLWGLRAGCLLATQAAERIEEVSNFLFWQPPGSGKPLIQQFLRLKAASEMIGGNAKGVVEGLREQLKRGESVDVAGYRVAPQLVAGLEQAVLVPPSGSGARGQVRWFEVSSRDDAGLSPASTNALQRWRDSGFDVDAQVVVGPAFWQTTEIEEAPSLIDATLAALAAAAAATSALAP
ncbi:MAG: hydrolase 2, exosortase A system-associated [Burkholderiaceae bacterium]